MLVVPSLVVRPTASRTGSDPRSLYPGSTLRDLAANVAAPDSVVVPTLSTASCGRAVAAPQPGPPRLPGPCQSGAGGTVA